MKPISWKDSKKVVSDTKIAKDILDMLIKTLPEEKQAFGQALINHSSEQLHDLAHKLYGACCYVSLPVLKQLLKNTMILITDGNNAEAFSQVPKINQEIDKIISMWELMNNRAAAIFNLNSAVES